MEHIRVAGLKRGRESLLKDQADLVSGSLAVTSDFSRILSKGRDRRNSRDVINVLPKTIEKEHARNTRTTGGNAADKKK